MTQKKLNQSVTSVSVRAARRTSPVAFRGEVPDEDDPLLGFMPYQHKAPRRNSITAARQRAFVAELAACGIVTQAARKVGVSLEALYKLRHRAGAEGFAAAWEAALDRGMARLEDCALERAILGEERPIVRDGEVVATWRRYDTGLLMFLLRQRRTQRFGLVNAIGPGDAAYERLKAMWIAEEAVSAEEVRESIERKLAAMKAVVLARAARERGEVADGEEEDDAPE